MKVFTKLQMDFCVGFCGTQKKNLIDACHLTFKFLRHSSASDILQVILDGIKELYLSAIAQISMDSSATDVKFFESIKAS